jgi:hypothetical protein
MFNEYRPIIVELSALGISGHPAFPEPRTAIPILDSDISDVRKEPPDAQSVDVNHRFFDSIAGSPTEPALNVRTSVSDVYNENAEFLIDQSMSLSAGLLSSSICNSSPKLHKWALMATKNLESLSEPRCGDSLKDIYKCLRVIWRLEGPKFLGFEFKPPFWGAPIKPISEHQIKLLRLQVTGFLEYTSDTKSSNKLMLRKFEQLEDTLRKIVSDVLG